jgi:hypothetical protein
MKKLILLFWVLLANQALAQESYNYLEIVVENGDSWINIRLHPLKTEASIFEKNLIKTVSFEDFINTQPEITQPEGFYLTMELDDWNKASSILNQACLPNGIRKQYITELATSLSYSLFGDSLTNLKREQFIYLWISLSRAVVSTNNHYAPNTLDLNSKLKQSALISELVWNLMCKSWTVADVRVFVLSKPNGLSTTLLIDAGGNVMTKIIISPEIYYRKSHFSYDLVNKSSRDLKNFGVSGLHKRSK